MFINAFFKVKVISCFSKIHQSIFLVIYKFSELLGTGPGVRFYDYIVKTTGPNRQSNEILLPSFFSFLLPSIFICTGDGQIIAPRFISIVRDSWFCVLLWCVGPAPSHSIFFFCRRLVWSPFPPPHFLNSFSFWHDIFQIIIIWFYNQLKQQ